MKILGFPLRFKEVVKNKPNESQYQVKGDVSGLVVTESVDVATNFCLKPGRFKQPPASKFPPMRPRLGAAAKRPHLGAVAWHLM